MYKKLFLWLFLSSSFLEAVEIPISFIEKSIKNATEREWSLSGANGGGYIFKIEHDFIGDQQLETLFSLSFNGWSHWFLLEDQRLDIVRYLRLSISGQWEVKKESGDFYTLDSYMDRGERKAYVIENRISPEGLFSKRFQVGKDISQSYYYEVSNDSKVPDGYSFWEPTVFYIKLEDYLQGNRDWTKFERQDWRAYGGFYTRNEEWITHKGDSIMKHWHPENAEKKEVQSFSMEMALNLTKGENPSRTLKTRLSERNIDSSPSISQNTVVNEDTERKGSSVNTKNGDLFAWLTGGAVLLGLLLFFIRGKFSQE